MASRQLVVFNVGNEEFGVEITNVKEINRPMEIFKVPNTPPYIEGLINLRGKVHTVFNLRKRFGLPAREMDDDTKIIMVSVNSMVIGFIVDGVKEILRVEDEDIERNVNAVTDLEDRFISGVAKTDSRIILLLDLESTFSTSSEQTKTAGA